MLAAEFKAPQVRRFWPKIGVAAFLISMLVVGLNWSQMANTIALQKAYQHDRAAQHRFELAVDRRINEHAERLHIASKAAATELSTFTSCAQIVYYLAWDSARSTSETEAFLSKTAVAKIAPAFNALAADIEADLKLFEAELRESSRPFTGQVSSTKGSGNPQLFQMAMEKDDKKAVQDASKPMVAEVKRVAFDSIFFTSEFEALATSLWRSLSSLARVTFAKQVTRVAASASIAAASGRLPIGEIIAAVMLAWSAYDIHEASKQFKLQAQGALTESLLHTKQHLRDASFRSAADAVKRHQQELLDLAKLSAPQG
ncbi:hypothetical protein LNV09_14550 [Paucibacter sp. B2R-40]|uniref:hypothetical protein n=1 Tax=Paucibacter sp. B2R-40 TaxID=2893554 RepID=UPI0021E42325|nr:hypothetical protein [Paucibacter sp. B2R-40]MCV2355371.1 hypothetical protein [Paucibacter sp. B2R-40]